MRKVWAVITINKKRKIAAVLAPLVLVAGSALAFYLFSPGANGTATFKGAPATTGTPMTIKVGSLDALAPGGVRVGTISDLAPGGSESVSLVVINPNNQTAQLSTVSGAVSVVDSPAGACQANWFEFDPPTGSLPMMVDANSNADSLNSGTLKFIETGTDQSGCEGADLRLDLSGT